jgi:glycosyltransferase involved in cell wall biosynthesis
MCHLRLLLVTDAWQPQVNGVVETLKNLVGTLPGLGMGVSMLTPAEFRTLPLPSYPDIRLALARTATIRRRMERERPDFVHIATEGPLGLLARRACLAEGMPFTTSYHTRFPEYLRARVPFPESLSYRWLRRFHNAGAGTLVATPSLADELRNRGFTNVRLWNRGVDGTLFNPSRRRELDLPRPVFLSVGRIAVEKNLASFLSLDLPGTKLVVGDGPDLARLRREHPEAVFLGARFGTELAELYASADVFVFPSRTDTFGMVLLEALASGLPVAAYPVTGPRDIIEQGRSGIMSEDLRGACLGALALSRVDARQRSAAFTWEGCAQLFMSHLDEAAKQGLSAA